MSGCEIYLFTRNINGSTSILVHKETVYASETLLLLIFQALQNQLILFFRCVNQKAGSKLFILYYFPIYGFEEV